MKVLASVSLAVLGLASLPGTGHAQDAIAAANTPAPDRRSTISLSKGWQFNLVGTAENGDDRPKEGNWETVSVPHSWNRIGYYKADTVNDRINTEDNVNKTQGIGWYYLEFEAPAATNGQRAFLEFDAASRSAEVWLNGQPVGENRNPFGRFRLDVTDALKFGAGNTLYVKVDNSAPVDGASTEDTLPLTGDFFVRGGLYRPVNLIITEPVHIDLLDSGGPGVYARTEFIEGEAASVNVRTLVKNDAATPQPIAVITSLLDASGREVATRNDKLSLGAGEQGEVSGDLRVNDPHLWQGTEDPYLYSLRTEIRSIDGKLLDALNQNFGLRTVELDPERGFLLNGKPYRLLGAGLHQDNEQSGWALSEEEVALTMETAREMGANALRLSHYQHGSPIHDLADKYGIVLWDEIALVTAWTTNDDQTVAPEKLRANARQQIRDMVRQNYNHPSVAVWGIANEVDFGPTRPDFLGRPPAKVPSPRSLLSELYEVTKAIDPTRSVVLAQCCELRVEDGVPVVADLVDAVGANRYFGWYYGKPSDLGPHLDKLLATHPDKPLAVSEIGAGGSIDLHTDNPLGGPIDMGGSTQPEEFQTWLHEQSWQQLKDRDYLWGVFLWNAIDFGTSVRQEGNSVDINTKGLVTYDRAIRKDAWYFYRANWSDEPTVHITGRRYIDRAYPVTDIRVHSNADSTSLTLNGRDLGTLNDCPEMVCVWQDVRLTPGTNIVRAMGSFDGREVEDEISWQLGASQVGAFRIDSGAILAADAPVQFGSDNFFQGGVAGTADTLRRGRPPIRADIAQTDRRDIVATFRTGDFEYHVPTEKGAYCVTLTFVEPEANPGERVFNVKANGKLVLPAYDISRQAGGVLTAVKESFEIRSESDKLTLDFDPVTGAAIVSAIEVEPLR
ncbi:glycoside hydrolase family 2 TIM barrel-domain containing protein [Altericroceibacterium endophyticum]|uniref:Glycoside hydrolase family 2 n=1 Tax=Altericroceibacterium endophyticum TaxID=1808508 RepID=A0A6I4T2F0_9SPHN|nr:glycoside hydrolase family 2 TIM barrel-domain containing protein [Altericroceibacterium endophyticum]MXO64512.1 glycoside hydrolase family 2 [Altericroceibacterium endophyticum]